MTSTAIRVLGIGDTKILTAQDLFDEFLQVVARSQLQWSLVNHSIKPDLLIRLFTLIAGSGVRLDAPLAVDLDANRLGTAQVGDFEVVLKALAAGGLQRLMVRFGFEISVRHLKEALSNLHMEDMYNERVFVNLPWENAGLLSLAYEMRQANDGMEKRIKSLEQRKDPSEQLRQMKGYRDTDDRLVEEGVSHAVATLLEDGETILASRYDYEGWESDLDGLVAGKWHGQDVVVLVEAKHNMDSSWRKAQRELFSAQKYWEQLANWDPAGDESNDESMLADYEALQVADHKQSRVMFAFGGSKFSEHTVQKHFNSLQTPWFHVVASASGKFVASIGPTAA